MTNQTNPLTIDLAPLTGGGRVRNLSGKERGIAARADLKIDDLDAMPNEVEVLVPDALDTISPSYFQGLFSESIARLKGRDGFLAKYHFHATPPVLEWIELGIRNATSSRKPLI